MTEENVVKVVAVLMVMVAFTLLGMLFLSIALPISLTFWQWVSLVLGIKILSFSPESKGGK